MISTRFDEVIVTLGANYSLHSVQNTQVQVHLSTILFFNTSSIMKAAFGTDSPSSINTMPALTSSLEHGDFLMRFARWQSQVLRFCIYHFHLHLLTAGSWEMVANLAVFSYTALVSCRCPGKNKLRLFSGAPTYYSYSPLLVSCLEKHSKSKYWDNDLSRRPYTIQRCWTACELCFHQTYQLVNISSQVRVRAHCFHQASIV